MGNFFSDDDLHRMQQQINDKLQHESNVQMSKQKNIDSLKRDLEHTANLFIEACKDFHRLAQSCNISPVRLELVSENDDFYPYEKINNKSFFGKFKKNNIPLSKPIYILGYLGCNILSSTETGQIYEFKTRSYSIVRDGRMVDLCCYIEKPFSINSLLSGLELERVAEKRCLDGLSRNLSEIILFATYNLIITEVTSDDAIRLNVKFLQKRTDVEIKEKIRDYFFYYTNKVIGKIDPYNFYQIRGLSSCTNNVYKELFM